jgi:hypothetical protein
VKDVSHKTQGKRGRLIPETVHVRVRTQESL